MSRCKGVATLLGVFQTRKSSGNASVRFIRRWQRQASQRTEDHWTGQNLFFFVLFHQSKQCSVCEYPGWAGCAGLLERRVGRVYRISGRVQRVGLRQRAFLREPTMVLHWETWAKQSWLREHPPRWIIIANLCFLSFLRYRREYKGEWIYSSSELPRNLQFMQSFETYLKSLNEISCPIMKLLRRKRGAITISVLYLVESGEFWWLEPVEQHQSDFSTLALLARSVFTLFKLVS
jgi:hypothetical protein